MNAFVRSLFFNHLSGSGGGVTPGITPLGTRFFRTDLTDGFDATSPSVGAVVGILLEPAVGNAGGGLLSKPLLNDVGSASRACR